MPHYLVKMVVFKHRNDPDPSEANGRASLSHLKHLLKNINPVTLASFLFTDRKIFTVTTPKNPQNDRLYAYLSSKKKDKTPRHEINVQSSTASVGEPQVIDSTPV